MKYGLDLTFEFRKRVFKYVYFHEDQFGIVMTDNMDSAILRLGFFSLIGLFVFLQIYD